jgi:hypothetical protein
MFGQKDVGKDQHPAGGDRAIMHCWQAVALGANGIQNGFTGLWLLSFTFVLQSALITQAFGPNSAVDLTAKNAKITKTDSYAWIAQAIH